MNSLEKFHSMLEMQETVNSKVNKDWRAAKNDWLLAYRAEISEIYAHDTRWKWWTKKPWYPETTKAIQIEVVDGWHFLMSDMLLNTVTGKGLLAGRIEEAYLKQQLERMISRSEPAEWSDCDVALRAAFKISLDPGMVDYKVWTFLALANCYCLNLDKLYTLYLAKSVLNIFRQDKSYAEGGYNKFWAGVEDNIALMDLDEVKLGCTDTVTIRAALDYKYKHSTPFTHLE